MSNFRKRLPTITSLVVTIAMSATVLLGAAEAPSPYRETLRFGGREGWDVWALLDGATTAPGWQGGLDVVLRQAILEPNHTTDALLTFERGLLDDAERYAVSSAGNAQLVDRLTARGAGAVAVEGGVGLQLRPAHPHALFASRRSASRFAIDLWVYVASVSEGSTVLMWQGARLFDGTPQFQELRMYIENRRLVWRLENLFVPAQGRSVIELRALQPAMPRRWQHHRLEFDGTTARVAYLIDGQVEAIRFITADGREDGTAVSFLTGEDTSGGVTLGRDFRGAFDEVRFSVDALPAGYQERPYSGQPGSVLSYPIDTGDAGTRLTAVQVRSHTAEGTAVRVHYRVDEQLRSFDPRTALSGEWRELPADGRLPTGVYGRFIQLRADLLAGAARQSTPRLQEIALTIERSPPPPPPSALFVEAVPGGIRVQWPPVQHPDVAGYRIHLGRAPGRYTGDAAQPGLIDVGDVSAFTISGLLADVPYVVAVEAYDRFGRSGALSAEREMRAGRTPQ